MTLPKALTALTLLLCAITTHVAEAGGTPPQSAPPSVPARTPAPCYLVPNITYITPIRGTAVSTAITIYGYNFTHREHSAEFVDSANAAVGNVTYKGLNPRNFTRYSDGTASFIVNTPTCQAGNPLYVYVNNSCHLHSLQQDIVYYPVAHPCPPPPPSPPQSPTAPKPASHSSHKWKNEWVTGDFITDTTGVPFATTGICAYDGRHSQCGTSCYLACGQYTKGGDHYFVCDKERSVLVKVASSVNDAPYCTPSLIQAQKPKEGL